MERFLLSKMDKKWIIKKFRKYRKIIHIQKQDVLTFKIIATTKNISDDNIKNQKMDNKNVPKVPIILCYVTEMLENHLFN